MKCHTLQLWQPSSVHAKSLFEIDAAECLQFSLDTFWGMLVFLPEEKVCEAAYWVCMKVPRGAAWGDMGA